MARLVFLAYHPHQTFNSSPIPALPLSKMPPLFRLPPCHQTQALRPLCVLSYVKPSDSNRWLCVPYSITPNISSSLAPAVTAIDNTPPLFIVSSVPCKRVYIPAVSVLSLDFRRPVNSLYRSFEAR